MKIYAICNTLRDLNNPVGFLFHYEKQNDFIIELNENLTFKEAPILFQKFVKNSTYVLGKHDSYLWVKERIVPSDRQNIGAILNKAKLTKYDEMSLLKIGKGKSSQDDCYIINISKDLLPKYVLKRQQKNIEHCYYCGDNNIVCTLFDKSVLYLDLKKLCKVNQKVKFILNKDDILQNTYPDCGGYSINIDSIIDIPAIQIRKMSNLMPFTSDLLINFVNNNLVDTSYACEVLKCSRQNLSQKIKENKIVPAKKVKKENLFYYSHILNLKQT